MNRDELLEMKRIIPSKSEALGRSYYNSYASGYDDGYNEAIDDILDLLTQEEET
jgi:hypothetical protein